MGATGVVGGQRADRPRERACGTAARRRHGRGRNAGDAVQAGYPRLSTSRRCGGCRSCSCARNNGFAEFTPRSHTNVERVTDVVASCNGWRATPSTATTSSRPGTRSAAISRRRVPEGAVPARVSRTAWAATTKAIRPRIGKLAAEEWQAIADLILRLQRHAAAEWPGRRGRGGGDPFRRRRRGGSGGRLRARASPFPPASLLDELVYADG